MNKKNLEILGLSEGASAEQIKTAYESLKAKYSEERFLDGEAGNNAAKMLTKIETAYNELLTELNEDVTSVEGGASFTKVEELIRGNFIQEAQRELDAFDERGAHWHYLQSVVFFRKNWINESKKQLEIAIQLDPGNERYKEVYRKMNEMNEVPGGQTYSNDPDRITTLGGYGGTGGAGGNGGGTYQGQNMNSSPDQQMGGGFCANCINFCCTFMCVNMLCNSCCR